MKKIIASVLAVLMLLMAVSLVGCGDGNKSDMEYVKEKGTLLVGITDFAPMDYQENGEWIGFDADYAKAFAEHLGVKAEFVEIEWEQKENELAAKNLDCVWNGMTLTDGVKEAMATSVAYCENAQVVVIKKDLAANYQTADSIKDLKIAVENGSAGDEVCTDLGVKTITRLSAQSDALMEVASGTSDACVIDLIMANAMTGEGTSYADLTTAVKLNAEEYGVGFRKGSDLAEELNKFMKASYADGTAKAFADKYGVVLLEIK